MELRTFLNFGYELFDFDYPFSDKAFSKEIENHIIDYYLFAEIGQETPERFKHVFRTTWLAMIDYYNELYNTTLLKYNPLINYKMSEALEQLRQTEGTEDTTANTQTEGQSNTTNTEDQEHQTTTEGTENVESSTTGSEGRTTKDKRVDDLESATNSSEDIEQTTNTEEKRSDYPQQSISSANYLSDAVSTNTTDTQEKTGKDTTTNTGTVENDGSVDIETEDQGESTTTTQTQEGGTNNTEGTSKTTTEGQEDNAQNRQTTGQENMNYRKTIEGITGKTYQELIALERNNIMRIKDMITKEMKKCFILVY